MAWMWELDSVGTGSSTYGRVYSLYWVVKQTGSRVHGITVVVGKVDNHLTTVSLWSVSREWDGGLWCTHCGVPVIGVFYKPPIPLISVKHFLHIQVCPFAFFFFFYVFSFCICVCLLRKVLAFFFFSWSNLFDNIIYIIIIIKIMLIRLDWQVVLAPDPWTSFSFFLLYV